METFAESSEAVSHSELFTPRIAVIGVGGAGTNTVHRISKLDIHGAELFAFNTDAKHLSMVNPSIKKLVLGESITRGLGAGGFPEIGEKAGELSRNEIEIMLKDINLAFLTAGMGGGTGTGASPVIADIAKRNGAIVIGIVTMPFALERVRLNVAKSGIEKLKRNVDTLIVIDNQRLFTLYPNMQIEKAFMLADEITAKAVKGITEAITQPSLIKLDFADVRTVMAAGGLAMISVGSASGHDRVDAVVESTLKNKLLDVDYTNAKGVLIFILGGPDMTLGEANEIGSKLTEHVSPDAYVTWGARIDSTYESKIEVMAIFAGVSGSSLFGKPAGEEREEGGAAKIDYI